ncbi:MAG: DUF4492 domain-containing protein [Prevotella sp.]|nr:DUF4492 domain-containing protein [Prevotella sp.]
MKKREKNFWHRAYDLYADGFRSMTLGKTLWAVILVKLFVIFAVLRVFFLPDFLRQHAGEGSEADYVMSELAERGSQKN